MPRLGQLLFAAWPAASAWPGAAVSPLGVGEPPIGRLVAEGLTAWVEGVAPRIGRPSVPA